MKCVWGDGEAPGRREEKGKLEMESKIKTANGHGGGETRETEFDVSWGQFESSRCAVWEESGETEIEMGRE